MAQADPTELEPAQLVPDFWSALGEDAPTANAQSFSRKEKKKEDTEIDPLFELGIANVASLHRPSGFLDILTSTKEDKNARMENFYLFSDLRKPPVPIESGGKPERILKKPIVHSIPEIDQKKVVKEEKDFLEDEYTDNDNWTTEGSHGTTLDSIKASTVPKPKKKKKKAKKKKRSQTPQEDVLTKEEALINYRLVIAEERLKEQLNYYKKKREETLSLKERMQTSYKRYDHEVQTIKMDHVQNDTRSLNLQNIWSTKINEAEEAISELTQRTVDVTQDLRSQIAQTNQDIGALKQDIRVWTTFRNGLMVENARIIEKLTNDLEHQKIDRKNYLELTDHVVELSEEFAKESEKTALNELCEHHMASVRDSLPPEELQGIEDYDILMAEIFALDQIHDDLVRQTDLLQKKILHQTAGAQVLLSSINGDNADLTRELLFTKWKHEWKHLDAPHLMADSSYTPDRVFDAFKELDVIEAKVHGLHVVGRKIFRKSKHATTPSSMALSRESRLRPRTFETHDTLTVPRLDHRSHSTISLNSTPTTEKSDVLSTVEALHSAELSFKMDDPLQNYAKPQLVISDSDLDDFI